TSGSRVPSRLRLGPCRSSSWAIGGGRENRRAVWRKRWMVSSSATFEEVQARGRLVVGSWWGWLAQTRSAERSHQPQLPTTNHPPAPRYDAIMPAGPDLRAPGNPRRRTRRRLATSACAAGGDLTTGNTG